MKCEVCGCPFRRIETSLVCQNGHTLQNMTEVAHDEDVPSAKTRRIRKKRRVKEYFKGSGCCLLKMILLKLMFEEAKVFFEIPNDNVFKYFTSFFKFKEGKLVSTMDLNKELLFTLLYSAKRSEFENKGQILLFKDFVPEFNKFGFVNRVSLIKNRFSQLEPACGEFLYPSTYVTLKSLRNILSLLSSPYKAVDTLKVPGKKGTCIIEECVEVSKFNFRRLFRNDFEIMNLYLINLCEELNVEITEEILFYFKKFIYTFDYNQVILPEFDFCFFIALYFINRNEFENKPIEFNMLKFLLIDRNSLLIMLWHYSKIVINLSTPEIHLKYLKSKSKYRFKKLRKAIDFIDVFKMRKAENVLNKMEKRKFKHLFPGMNRQFQNNKS